MADTMMTPVTPQLATELAATERVLNGLVREAAQARGRKLNDHDHFGDVADALETLVVTLLSATSAVPLLKRAALAGASFDFGAGTELAKRVTSAVAYLRDDASAALVRPLSRYESINVDPAYARLKTLYSVATAAIKKQAIADLEAVKQRGVEGLLNVASVLATAAAGSEIDH